MYLHSAPCFFPILGFLILTKLYIGNNQLSYNKILALKSCKLSQNTSSIVGFYVKLSNTIFNKKLCSRFETAPFDFIWLEISTNWHTSSQGPKKKSIQITKGRIDPCPAHTARNKGSFTTMVLWIVQGFLGSTVSSNPQLTLDGPRRKFDFSI